MASRKKILWLTSWYPNREDAFDGDFIQRHARAAAIYHDIHVVMVRPIQMQAFTKEDWNEATGLTEQILYFKRKNGLLSSYQNFRNWKLIFRKALKHYLAENGMPHCVHVHIPWKAGLMALWLKKHYHLPYILSEHWGIYFPGISDYLLNRPWWVQKPTLQIFNEAAEIVSVSRYLANGIFQLTNRQSKILPNVVDTTLFYQREAKYSRFTFIHVSNMVALKNVDYILQAFHELVQNRDVQLIMIGNRDDTYIRMASEMNLLNRSVFFRGEVSYQDVAREIRMSHSLLICSESETFSCVTAEALCAGLPVIASNRGALPELVEEGKNGMLIPPDPSALIHAMRTMVDNYSHFDLPAISREASSKFGYEAVSLAFDELYRQF